MLPEPNPSTELQRDDAKREVIRRRLRWRPGKRRRLVLTELALKRRLGRPAPVAVVPTLMTLGNSICGFGSIAYVIQVEQGQLSGHYTHYMFCAGLLIFAAMIFDVLDGHIARLTRQSTNFGKHLDSLCDVVSFGVAPALIVSKFSYHYHWRLLWVVGLFYMIAVILRLARFGSESDGQTGPRDSFTGLPCPAAAGMIASVAVAVPAMANLAEYGSKRLSQEAGARLVAFSSLALPIIALAVAWLMVSKIEYQRIDRWLRARRTFHDLVPLVFAVVVVVAAHELAMPLILLYFVLSAPAAALRRWWRRPSGAPQTSLETAKLE